MEKLVETLATFFYVGRLPKAPGTYASVVGLGLAWCFEGTLFHFTLFWTLLGLWVCAPAVKFFQDPDPGVFVLDEVCGMLVSVLWIPKSIVLFLAAFLLFRALDIWKPWPIRSIEKWKNRCSIMADDLAAGLIANGILQFVTRFVI